MNRLKFIIVSIFLINNFIFSDTLEEQNKDKQEISFEQNIKRLLDKDYSTFLINKKVLKDYYQINQYKPYWIDEKAKIKDIALNLLEKIKNDPVLQAHISKIFKFDEVINSLNSLDKSNENYIDSMLRIEFMMTELYDKYAFYLLNGSINWKAFQEKLTELEKDDEINAQWDRYEIKKNPKELLKLAIENNDLSLAFKELDFTYPNAQKLINAISDLETIIQNGDYIKLPEFKTLRIGDQSEIVKILRERLAQSKDLNKTCENVINTENIVTNSIEEQATEQIEEKESVPCEEIFDEDLKNAVISFQKTHGLFADGIVGLQTQKFLNKSAKEKIEQIRLNLERMRWLPRNFGDKYILINIPEYRLRMIENNDIKLNMAVVVGERKHPTPIFSDKMSYIVLNPNWNIPESITKKEILPKLLKDPNYLASKGIDIYQGWHKDSEKVETTEVLDTLILQDIDSVPNFRFTQGPSDENPLGRMKFMFPNKHAVYLHDTPAKSLFNNARRAYSHGCIRLSKPEELLSTILDEDKTINSERVNQILSEETEKEKAIGLSKKIPVHIIYLTSFVDENGKLQFREDIYNYDKIQEKLMF
ncbi:MAG: L,D-transpeptidase family protein [Arcobacter sp.]|jgi:murein L,D-transpeptidase YcbB/YkuD|uniref:L,D-transpeptidase family protein n=1 Tax=Arcobacter sp. TaxID=1872629 RepID=UPI002A7563D4|nr:L,D-transpeptidase family protein [Arcobacter sp.]MDY3200901.1 L,D-transpeptidase family protein [Arcobacter sp.]